MGRSGRAVLTDPVGSSRHDDASVGIDPSMIGTTVEPLPEALTWAATFDPHDDTHEIEITDEMVSLAIAEIEREQVYPFGRGATPVARPIVRADVIPFPERRRADV